MPKFRKKPIVIEATQWFKNGDHPEDKSLIIGDHSLSEGKVVRFFRTPEYFGEDKCLQCGRIYHDHGWVDTLEGGHIVCPGNWLITGIKGEYYPCQLDIFEQTYELVEEAQ